MSEVQEFKNNTLIIGDLHISDRYTGRHVDYWSNCIEVLDMITEAIIDNKVTHVILTGDIVGMNEKNLRHRESLVYLMLVFRKWGELTNGNVYSVKGNHDMDGKMTDFDIFTTLGVIKTAEQLDIGETRFHLMDYGDIRRVIEVDDDKYNIAVVHDNIQVEGLTTWFNGGAGYELSELKNLYGVSLVVAGHIHEPSIKTVSTTIIDKEISLFYVGNPTRPKYDKNIWNTCFGMLVQDDGTTVGVATVNFNLKPKEELFCKTMDDITTEELLGEDGEEKESGIDIEELSSILEELQRYNIGGGFDYKSQISRVAGLDKEASDLALMYVESVERELLDK